MGATNYSDISPRTQAFVVKQLLDRGMPFLVFEKFGQAKPIPANSTQSIKFRRYFLDQTFTDFGGKWNAHEALASSNFTPSVKVLTEGQTPTATALKSEDITASLSQYGDLVTISDVIMDTHEDPILQEATAIMGEQAAVIVEKIRFNVLKAGTAVQYANGSARNAVNTVLTLEMQRKITRQLKRNLGKPITNVVRSTAAYGTENVAPAFVAVVHPDIEPDIRNIAGFVPVEKYGQISPWENEIGKIEDVRYISSTIVEPWADAGGNANNGTYSCLSTTGTKADVYPILYLAKDAYGIVPLKGLNAVTPIVVNPKPSDSDPLGQRGHVGWKTYQTAVILNDAFMCRAEVGAKAL